MKLVTITKDNFTYALEIQEELFPEESGRKNFEESLKKGSAFSYYLLYEDDICIGVIGLYENKDDPDSAWLGWFGIRENYRRKHLGSKALKMFEDMAVSKGYSFARLYTDENDNDAAVSFYRNNGYYCEHYVNHDDPISLTYRVLIFSKSLSDEELILWNNRNIYLTEQIAKQNS